MKIGFIGAAGNMAGAIIESVISSVNYDTLYVFDINKDGLKKFSDRGAVICDTSVELAKESDIIFFCVKPQVLPTVLAELKGNVSADKCIASICAGIKIDSIKEGLGFDASVIRIMPNTPLMIGSGASGVARKSPVTDEEFKTVFSIFAASGTAVEVDESQMDAVTAVSGSGPAYVYRFVKDIALQGEKLGLSYAQALDLAVATVIGSAHMIEKNEKSDEALQTLIDKVTSPNGTTYAALCSMDKDNFDGALMNAVQACADRSAELAKGK